MMWVIGVVLFALAILVSVALHECGHMWVARATGMKVRRYFVGFGPTLWSTRRPNKLGSTEYGVKAVPLGGFCDIAGMTSIDEIAPEDRALRHVPAEDVEARGGAVRGPGMNFIVGLAILYGIALYWGLPNLNPQQAAARQRNLLCRTSCQQGEARRLHRRRTGGRGGSQAGRRHRQGRRHRRAQLHEMVDAVRKLTGPTPFVIERDGQQFTTVIDVVKTERYTSKEAEEPTTVGAVGIAGADFAPVEYTQYNPVTAIPGTVAFTGDLAVEIGKSLAKIPTKIGALVHSIGGGERDPETPISVVGASIIGGDAFERGLFMAFWFFLAQLNFVLGAINLVPLLPFDGGHIAVAWFEKIRNVIPQGAWHGRRSAGELPQADARHLRDPGFRRRLHGADRDR